MYSFDVEVIFSVDEACMLSIYRLWLQAELLYSHCLDWNDYHPTTERTPSF